MHISEPDSPSLATQALPSKDQDPDGLMESPSQSLSSDSPIKSGVDIIIADHTTALLNSIRVPDAATSPSTSSADKSPIFATPAYPPKRGMPLGQESGSSSLSSKSHFQSPANIIIANHIATTTSSNKAKSVSDGEPKLLSDLHSGHSFKQIWTVLEMYGWHITYWGNPKPLYSIYDHNLAPWIDDVEIGKPDPGDPPMPYRYHNKSAFEEFVQRKIYDGDWSGGLHDVPPSFLSTDEWKRRRDELQFPPPTPLKGPRARRTMPLNCQKAVKCKTPDSNDSDDNDEEDYSDTSSSSCTSTEST